MPIPSPMNSRAAGILGFICADSSYGEVTSGRVVRSLAILAWHLYDVFSLYVDVSSINTHENSGEELRPRVFCKASELGWVLRDGELEPRNLECQLNFQRFVLSMEDSVQRNVSHPARPKPAPGGVGLGSSALLKEQRMGDREHFAYLAESYEDPPQTAALSRLAELSDFEHMRIFKKIAERNSYARELVAHAAARGIGQHQNDKSSG
jgi:hypothetical protein